MTLMIELPDEKTAVLVARARARGLSSEQYVRRLLEQDLESAVDQQAVWEVLANSMKDIPPEDLALLPRDGAQEIDHYIYGVPKRDA